VSPSGGAAEPVPAQGHVKRVSRNALRTARLAFDAELSSGELHESDVAAMVEPGWSSERGLRNTPIARVAERLAMKLGALDGLTATIGHSIVLRRRVLGTGEDRPPRFLVRVDEFPYSASWYAPARYDAAATREFHAVLVSQRLPYLLAVLPRPAIDYLDPHVEGERPLGPDELELLGEMKDQGVTFAQHGTTHRTRFRSPRRRSELGGLGEADLARLLEDGRHVLETQGITASVLVPPFNRFDARQWPELARRYAVVTGGPESVRLVGARSSPSWWGDSVYMPSYPPLYADARTILGVLDQIMRVAAGCWVPIVLHSAWEIDDGLESLRKLAGRVTEHAVEWGSFLDAVARSARVVDEP
jgi:uncharacterized protein DUF2334